MAACIRASRAHSLCVMGPACSTAVIIAVTACCLSPVVQCITERRLHVSASMPWWASPADYPV